MRMKKVTVIIMTIMMMLWSQCAGADTESIVMGMLDQELSYFMNSEDTQETPIYSVSGSDVPYMLIYCGTTNHSQKVIDTSLIAYQDWKCDWEWNSFEAGERVAKQIGELYTICKAMQELGQNMPIQVDTYEECSERNGGYTKLEGMDSLYIHGEAQASYGKMKWEMYPFFLGDGDDVFENAMYIYCRMLIPIDEQGEQVQHFFIADQERVTGFLKQLMKLSLNISAQDDALIREYIRIQETLMETARMSEVAPTSTAFLAATLTPTPSPATTSTSGPTTTDTPIPASAPVLVPEGSLIYEVTEENSAKITGYYGDLVGNIALPEYIHGYPVREIGEKAFYSCNEITGIVMPRQLEVIQKLAFAYCENLQYAELNEGIQGIGQSAFYSCKGLERINLPDSITEIGNNAFDSCVRLQEIHIPTGIREIKSAVFRSCYGLQQIKIPDNVTRIGVDAFAYCFGIKDIEIPASVTSIEPTMISGWQKENGITMHTVEGSAAYAYMERINVPHNIVFHFSEEPLPNSYALYETEECEDGTLRIVEYNGREETIHIPAKINGVKVTEIGTRAFAYNCYIKEVIVPDGVTKIDTGAFSVCLNLERFVMPDSVVDISGELFDSCHNLKEVQLSQSLTEIDYRTFNFCISLETVELPDSIVSIDEEAFQCCYALKDIELPKHIVKIPKGMFFRCSALETLTIPESVETIEKDAFKECTALKKLTIPAFVSLIGVDAFSECANLELWVTEGSFADTYAKNYLEGMSIKRIGPDGTIIDDDIDSFDYEIIGALQIEITGYRGNREEVIVPEQINGFSVVSIAENAFKENAHIKRVVFPDGVTAIGKKAFSSCTKLKEVILPETLLSIGDYAFAWCNRLKQIELPDSLETLGGNIFVSCYGLEEMVIPENVTKLPRGIFDQCKRLKTVKLPENLVSIEREAFRDCSNLVEIVLPEGMINLGNEAFRNCTSLKTINLPKSINSIASGVFEGCKSLKSIELPEHLTAIGSGVFSDCESLTSIHLPLGILEIPDSCFSGCSMLMDVKYSDQITSIGEHAFAGCGLLKEILVPDTVRYIGAGAFGNCESLEKMVIPEGVVTIGARTFDWCQKLKTLRIPESVTIIDSLAFYECRNTVFEVVQGSFAESYLRNMRAEVKYYTPEKQSNARKTNTSTETVSASDFVFDEKNGVVFVTKYNGKATILEIPKTVDGKEVSVIGKNAFKGNRYLQEVIIPEGVTQIGEEAFHQCESLQKVSIPDSVTVIGDGAFQECSALQKIQIPGSVKRIGSWTFSKCKNLRQIELGYGIAFIDRMAFYDCVRLEKCVIPSSVVIISGTAFERPSLQYMMHDYFNQSAVKGLVFYVEKGSNAEQYARQQGISYKNTQIEHTYSSEEVRERQAETIEVIEAGLCELTKDNEWVSEKGETASLADLTKGNVFGHYIKFVYHAQKAPKTLSSKEEFDIVTLSFYRNGKKVSSRERKLSPGYVHSIWYYPSDEKNATGTEKLQWYIGSVCVYETAVTINKK